MRRRLSWAVLGTSGVLAVVVATMISTGEPERTASPKIVVPMADDAVIEVPTPPTTRPSTVFIDVPPVAVTSEAVIPAQPAVVAPKKAPPVTAKPVVPASAVTVPAVVPTRQVRQSIWDVYAVYLNYYGAGTYSDKDRDNDRRRDGGRRDGRRGR